MLHHSTRSAWRLRLITLVTAATTLVTVSGAWAEIVSQPAVIIELYTSQGCSSCPPADEFLAQLATVPGLLPLALHVDYWDYIGWEDSFAQAKFTERQHSYARAVGDRMVYTPQMIVAGTERVEGNNVDKVNALATAHLGLVPQLDLQVERAGDQISISAKAAIGMSAPILVQLVRYVTSETVSIERGENAGKTVMYRNIVTEWSILGEWSGQSDLALMVPISGTDPLVVILQKPGPSEILAAARID